MGGLVRGGGIRHVAQPCPLPRDVVALSRSGGRVLEPESAAPKPYRLTAVFVREEYWKLVLWSGSEPA